MLHKLRQRAQDEKGFTLIELLVVILIIGILAAIALPAFLNQREKAQDSTAKSDARTAQTAMETYYTDNQKYTNAPADLTNIEPAITQFASRMTLAGDTTTYSVGVKSKGSAEVTYTIARDATGNVTRSCAPIDKGSCPHGGSW